MDKPRHGKLPGFGESETRPRLCSITILWLRLIPTIPGSFRCGGHVHQALLRWFLPGVDGSRDPPPPQLAEDLLQSPPLALQQRPVPGQRRQPAGPLVEGKPESTYQPRSSTAKLDLGMRPQNAFAGNVDVVGCEMKNIRAVAVATAAVAAVALSHGMPLRYSMHLKEVRNEGNSSGEVNRGRRPTKCEH